MADDGDHVSLSQLCRWFSMPRRTLYYKPTKSEPKMNPDTVRRVKAFIDKHPDAGYHTTA